MPVLRAERQLRELARISHTHAREHARQIVCNDKVRTHTVQTQWRDAFRAMCCVVCMWERALQLAAKASNSSSIAAVQPTPRGSERDMPVKMLI